VGGLPLDIWAVSNVEVYGRHIKGELCEVCVCTHVFIRPPMLDGGLLCEVWFFPFQNIPDWDKTAVSRGENIQLGCLYSRMRSCVL